jgi:osmoprotectant transport system permease protein
VSALIDWLAGHPRVFLDAGRQHLALSATALAAVLAVALPLALALVRRPRAAAVAVGLANVLRTIPSLAVLVVLMPLLGTGFLPSVVALAAYGLPAILINALTGLTAVDPDLIDAARGQGMTNRQVTARVRVPLALPVAFAGIRTAAVQIVSAATLAAFIGGGGFGDLITAGMGTLDVPQLVAGALAVAALALALELGLGRIESGLARRVGTGA